MLLLTIRQWLQTFVLIQTLLSFTPVAVFLAFALGTLALSFITALLFSLFWIGIALFVLVPTLFITVSLGIVLWVWAVSSFLVARWVYNIVPVRVIRTTDGEMPNYFCWSQRSQSLMFQRSPVTGRLLNLRATMVTPSTRPRMASVEEPRIDWCTDGYDLDRKTPLMRNLR